MYPALLFNNFSKCLLFLLGTETWYGIKMHICSTNTNVKKWLQIYFLWSSNVNSKGREQQNGKPDSEIKCLFPQIVRNLPNSFTVENSLFSYLYYLLMVGFFLNYGLYFCHLFIDHELIQKFLTKGTGYKINPLSCNAFASFGSEIKKGKDNHQERDSRVEYGFSPSDRYFLSAELNNYVDKGWVCVCVWSAHTERGLNIFNNGSIVLTEINPNIFF